MTINKEQAVSDAPSPLGKNPKLNELIALVAVAAARESGNGYDLETIKRHADHAANLWASHPLEQQQAVSGDVEWHPHIGEEVIVVPENCEPWGNDWRAADGTPLVVFVAGIDALRGGGLNITVSETWPLKPRGAFDADSLTDGFIIGRDEGLDQLRPLHPRAALTASGVGTWQPIETAPRDGTKVLGGRVRPDGETAWAHIMSWHSAGFYADRDGGDAGDYLDGWDDENGDECCPTHWQSLPSAQHYKKKG